MLVFGWGDKNNLFGVTDVRRCSRCGNSGPWVVYETKKQFKLYWVPVARWNKRIVAECMVCPNSIEVSEDDARRLVAEGEQELRDRFVRAAAAVLKSVARIEGFQSSEWAMAREALVLLADRTISHEQAEQLLKEVTDADLDVSQFDEEQRLVLLRVAVDVAIADGSFSQGEVAALEALAARLGIGRNVVHALIGMLAGHSPNEGPGADVEHAYRVLEVQTGAAVGEVRAAYKRLMLRHHPDRVAPEKREAATKRAAEINAAYNLLIGRNRSAEGSGSAPPNGAQAQARPHSNPPPHRNEPTRPKRPSVCGACERRLSQSAKFCGYCGTKVA